VIDLLRTATCFDWISPTLAIVNNTTRGPSHTFLVPIHCGWTGNEIAKMLRQQGVKTWGHMIVNGSFMITVQEQDAQRASGLMGAHGLSAGGRSIPTNPRPPRRSRLWSLLE